MASEPWPSGFDDISRLSNISLAQLDDFSPPPQPPLHHTPFLRRKTLAARQGTVSNNEEGAKCPISFPDHSLLLQAEGGVGKDTNGISEAKQLPHRNMNVVSLTILLIIHYIILNFFLL